MAVRLFRDSILARLALIPSVILALGIAVAIGATLAGARGRIASEEASGVTLGDHLIRFALDDLAAARSPGDRAATARRLREGLAQIRHIRVAFPDAPPPPPSNLAPAWFTALLRPPEIVKTYSLGGGAEPRGEIVMRGEPSDESAEIWSGLLFLTALLGLLSFAIVTLMVAAARHALAPLRQLLEGLDRLGRGQFGALPQIGTGELAPIAAHFNRLSATLARSEADNHLLIDRLMSVQDAERKELARELHDEFGASLFGIRAAASCIVEAASAEVGPEAKTEIVERARSVSALADAIQKQNYRILERIRPMVLRQMGLAEALAQLVESFRAQHKEFSCAIEVSETAAGRRFDEEASLTAYRIAQEGLTNVARHSGADSVCVSMEVARAPSGAEEIRLAVEDDGVGPPPELRYGYGLLGMSERVRKLDGRLTIKEGEAGGTRIEAVIPLAPQRAQNETPRPTGAETTAEGAQGGAES
ncbi:ATP-binding protein [Methylocella sp.]|uniref:ATP-binding protein n=1 Tax=Methylocella sp. TaxID=1978226 RepID=UPI003784ADBB